MPSVGSLTYQLSIAPDEVRARLVEVTHRPVLRDNLIRLSTGGLPVVGEVDADKFWWQLPHYTKHFAPWMSGRISSGPAGSTVVLEMHSALSRKVLAVGGIAVLGLLFVGTVLAPARDFTELLARAAGIVAVLAVPIGVVRLYGDEPRRLRETFEAMFVTAREQRMTKGF